MVIAVNCDDCPVHLEIPLAGHVKKAINVLDAKIDWEKEPKEGLDFSECAQLLIKDNVLYLELPANGGKLIWMLGG